jgi:hypothetical protein
VLVREVVVFDLYGYPSERACTWVEEKRRLVERHSMPKP